MISVAAYCLVFGGLDPLPVAKALVFGPAEVASSEIAAEYGGLRQFVWQTVVRNLPLYAFCFAGMLMELRRIAELGQRQRIALIFSVVITVLVFAHNQPWPYVFIMALPFVSLLGIGPGRPPCGQSETFPVGSAGARIKLWAQLRSQRSIRADRKCQSTRTR